MMRTNFRLQSHRFLPGKCLAWSDILACAPPTSTAKNMRGENRERRLAQGLILKSDLKHAHMQLVACSGKAWHLKDSHPILERFWPLAALVAKTDES